MAQNLTRGEIQDLLSKFAAENPKYRAALVSDPKGIIEKQLGVSLGNVKVKAVVETCGHDLLVVPHVASEGELSDATSKKWPAANRTSRRLRHHQGGGAVNTVMQLNL